LPVRTLSSEREPGCAQHIHVRSQATTDSSELGHFSPYFLWLLRDFYLDLRCVWLAALR
jgi:hypothetical protein